MATAKIYLDTRRVKNDGTYPVKVRITHERIPYYFPTIYSFTTAEFEKIDSGFRLSESQREISIKLDAILLRANTIIKELEPFDIDVFTLRFTSKGDRAALIFLLTDKSEQLREQKSYSNANLYSQAAALLQKYHSETSKSPKLLISKITPKWLTNFESWAISKGYSITTVGMYLIRVRAILNSTIISGEFNRALYPFGKDKYVIPAGNNNKRALALPEVMKLYNYKPLTEGEAFGRDMFIFSYLANGMNNYDIFRLKWSAINAKSFTFIRKKTETKTRGQNVITVQLTDDLIRIIEEHGSRKLNNDYVFNIIKPGMSALDEMMAVKRATTLINSNLKQVAKKLDLPTSLSSYYARHSYATNLMNSEAPVLFISKQLGHADISTTQNYLSSFADTKAVEYHSKLLDKNAG